MPDTENLIGLIIGAVLILALFSFAFKLLSADPRNKPDNAESDDTLKHTYRSQGTLLSPAELDAFRRLVRGFQGLAYICPKVRIADILTPEKTSKGGFNNAGFLKISQKHVDFVVISFSGDILFALEVDDRSHDTQKGRKRDTFVNAAFESAGVELVRVRANRLNESDQLKRKLRDLKNALAFNSDAA